MKHGPLVGTTDLNASGSSNASNGVPETAEVTRQKWIIAITDHVEFSNYYIKSGLEQVRNMIRRVLNG
jgi:hypothetical protein